MLPPLPMRHVMKPFTAVHLRFFFFLFFICINLGSAIYKVVLQRFENDFRTGFLFFSPRLRGERDDVGVVGLDAILVHPLNERRPLGRTEARVVLRSMHRGC